MFQGSHPYHIDDKGRLKLPAEFVAELSPEFTITRGRDGCLWALPQAEWSRLVNRLTGESLMDPRQIALQRYFIGSAVTAAPDGQGRVALPQVLRQYAGIGHEVMVVGAISRVEIWDRARWEEYLTQISDDTIEELARSAGI